MSNFEKFKVLGYIRPAQSFYTLDEWQSVVEELIDLQAQGFDTRGGEISCKYPAFCTQDDMDRFVGILSERWGYQLDIETERYDLLTMKNVLDFIEDFVNHRFWGFEREFGSYFPDINRLRFAYFYSRGDMEPYVMLDEEYTTQLYGSLDNVAELQHFTSDEGLRRLEDAIHTGEQFDISTFTVAEREFFRSTSNLSITLLGNVKAAFRSDIKSLALDDGKRACNMYRLEYPGTDVNNICYDLDACLSQSRVSTNLWNEYIASPVEILDVRQL
jgi:hypothetical protein